jgi:hypothetical protein
LGICGASAVSYDHDAFRKIVPAAHLPIVRHLHHVGNVLRELVAISSD